MTRRTRTTEAAAPTVALDESYLQRDLLVMLRLRGLHRPADLSALMGTPRQVAEKFYAGVERGRRVFADTLARIGAAAGVRAHWIAVRPEHDAEPLRRKLVHGELKQLREAYLRAVEDYQEFCLGTIRRDPPPPSSGGPHNAEDYRRAVWRCRDHLAHIAGFAKRLGYVTEGEHAAYLAEPEMMGECREKEHKS